MFYLFLWCTPHKSILHTHSTPVMELFEHFFQSKFFSPNIVEVQDDANAFFFGVRHAFLNDDTLTTRSWI